MAIFLKEVVLRKPLVSQTGRFPFTIPAIQGLESLEFSTPVTIFVGENGTGKSTLIEAIACAANLVVVGSEDIGRDKTLAHVRPLAECLKLSWQKRSRRGFFLRAEDFFGYARRMAHARQDLEQELRRVDEEYHDKPEAIGYARMPFQGELQAIRQRYGEGLDQASHGEAFLNLFQTRFVPDGLYLLDEPEAPLSPVRQLALISMLKKMMEQNAQFIIATHSPILMAYPDACILSFDSGKIHPVAYSELEHVILTRDFLNDPQAYLRHL
jgi:predicted ATPase